MRIYNCLRKMFFSFAVLLIGYKVSLMMYYFPNVLSSNLTFCRIIFPKTTRMMAGHNVAKTFKITWFNPPVFVTYRRDAMRSGFGGCIYDNCKMSYISTDARQSDVVILTGHFIPEKMPFTRPEHQVWIFSEHEPPYRYNELSTVWNQSNVFNWTMTYDKNIADIHLPYGEIKAVAGLNNTDFKNIMQQKTKTALMIMSHCNTPAERVRYVEELRKYIDVDILGKCGTKWMCGKRIVHDDCFQLINSYKFYLAFENSFCNNYFTEKVFDNFDYDTVLVSRGGLKGQSRHILPKGTFIPAEDFSNPKELGNYLKSMSHETYINILRQKNQFTSMNSYVSMFQNAICEICYRMNNLDKFKKTINDMNKWAFSFEPCKQPNDLE